jgi:hypothetical protein
MESSKKQIVRGSSLINHNVRQKLGLSVSEYVLLQFIQDMYEDGMGISEFAMWTMLGISQEMFGSGLMLLQSKNLVVGSESTLRPYPQWDKAHKEKGFEFGLFWQPVTIEGDVIEWRNSSKTSAKWKMGEVLKAVPIEYLIYSKLRYFFSKWESKSFDYVMGAPVFLGPDKHYNTRYSLKQNSESLLASHIYQFYGGSGTINLVSFLGDRVQAVQKVPVINSDYFNDNE